MKSNPVGASDTDCGWCLLPCPDLRNSMFFAPHNGFTISERRQAVLQTLHYHYTNQFIAVQSALPYFRQAIVSIPPHPLHASFHIIRHDPYRPPTAKSSTSIDIAA